MRWLLLLPLLALTACSTVESRIKENPAAFNSLSPKQQTLVQNGRIAEDMSKAAVYIAWGRPDDIITGSSRGKSFEEWLYETTYVDFVSYYRPYPVYYGRRYWGWDYFYDPIVVYSPPYVYKSVRLENGRVVGWRQMPRR
ncbi:MAG TPA: hypothetical protein VIT91_00330 [Chthoniobacterales bacterium]